VLGLPHALAAMEAAAAEYTRMLCLERENQALRDQIRDLQSLVQVKDSEITLKYHLLQAKERENTQARSRLQWLEASIKQAADAEALRILSSSFDRNQLLRFNSALKTLGLVDRPFDLVHLTCAEREDEDPETPSKDSPFRDKQQAKTPSTAGKKAREALREAAVEGAGGTPLSSPSPGAATPTGAKGRGRGRTGGEPLVWRERKKASKEPPEHDAATPLQAAAQDAPSPASTASKSSPGGRRPPPALELLCEEPEAPSVEVGTSAGTVAQEHVDEGEAGAGAVTFATAAVPAALIVPVECGGGPGDQRIPEGEVVPWHEVHPDRAEAVGSQYIVSTPSKRLPILDPSSGKRIEELQPVVTPSKRLAIVDPTSGKQIEVTPSTEGSRMKPTLISLEAISENRTRQPPPLSPVGPSAPPLTLPPVVAGAPPLATQPLRSTLPGGYGGYLPPGPSAGVSVGGMPGGLVPQAPLPSYAPAAGLSGPGSSGWPPPGAMSMPGAGQPAWPPPIHPAPAVGEALGLADVATAAAVATAVGSTPPAAAADGAPAECSTAAALAPQPPEHSIAERLCDALGGSGGGLVQMARGPLAAGTAPPSSGPVGSGPSGVVGRPSEPPPPPPPPLNGEASGVAAAAPAPIGPGPPPPPLGPAPLPPASAVPISPLGTVPMPPPGTTQPQLGLSTAGAGGLLPASARCGGGCPWELFPPGPPAAPPSGMGLPPPLGLPPPSAPPPVAPPGGAPGAAPPGPAPPATSGLLGFAGYGAPVPPLTPSMGAAGLLPNAGGGDGSGGSTGYPQPPQVPPPPPSSAANPVPAGAASSP